MGTRERLIKARLRTLALAEELQNIALACRRTGISRSQYYEIKQAFEKYGPEGLVPRPRRPPRMPNQTPPELEQQILRMTERHPTASYLRIARHLRLLGVDVTPSAVRYVWERRGLSLRDQRLLWATLTQIMGLAKSTPLETEGSPRRLTIEGDPWVSQAEAGASAVLKGGG
jgi:transposase